MTSSTLTDGALCPLSAKRDFRLGAARPATSPPTIAPATSTAPTETHQRMAALPSFMTMVAPETLRGKRKHAVIVHIAAIERVGWVERSETHQLAAERKGDGFCCALPIL